MSAEEAARGWGTSNFAALQLLIQYVHLNGVYTFSIKLLPSSWQCTHAYTVKGPLLLYRSARVLWELLFQIIYTAGYYYRLSYCWFCLAGSEFLFQWYSDDMRAEERKRSMTRNLLLRSLYVMERVLRCSPGRLLAHAAPLLFCFIAFKTRTTHRLSIN